MLMQKRRKTIGYLLVALVLVVFLLAFTGCSAEYPQHKQTEDIRVVYSTETETSIVIVPITLYNPTSTMLKEVTVNCHFLDESGNLLDTKERTFQLTLESESHGHYDLEFLDVKGVPTDVELSVIGADYENVFVAALKNMFDLFFGWLLY